MDRMTAGLLGMVAGAAGIAPAHAGNAAVAKAPDALRAASYADLLAPIPNAAAALKADDALRARAGGAAGIQSVQYSYYYNGQPAPYAYVQPYYGGPYGVYAAPAPYYNHHHHHHHHHHHNNYYGGRW